MHHDLLKHEKRVSVEDSELEISRHGLVCFLDGGEGGNNAFGVAQKVDAASLAQMLGKVSLAHVENRLQVVFLYFALSTARARFRRGKGSGNGVRGDGGGVGVWYGAKE